MKKFIITEEERKHIRRLYEQQSNVPPSLEKCESDSKMIKALGVAKYKDGGHGSQGQALGLNNAQRDAYNKLTTAANNYVNGGVTKTNGISAFEAQIPFREEIYSKNFKEVDGTYTTYFCAGVKVENIKKVKTNDNQQPTNTTGGNVGQQTKTDSSIENNCKSDDKMIKALGVGEYSGDVNDTRQQSQGTVGARGDAYNKLVSAANDYVNGGVTKTNGINVFKAEIPSRVDFYSENFKEVDGTNKAYCCIGVKVENIKKVKANDNQQQTDATGENTAQKTTQDDKIVTNYDKAYDYKLTSDDKVYFKGKQGTKYGNKYPNWSEPLSSNAEDAIRTKVFKQ